MSNTTVNSGILVQVSNTCFVQGSRRGNRADIARLLATVFRFKGGYRASYRAVGEGYESSGIYAGKLNDGHYGMNATGM